MNRATTILAVGTIVFASGCAAPAPDNFRETYLDADYQSLPVVDVAILEPSLAVKGDRHLAAVMREAARAYLLDVKTYSVPADRGVDAEASAAGVTSDSDGSTAARAIMSADATLLIRVTEWDKEWLLPRGAVYASGTVALYGKRDGRRIYETTFTRERLAVPGKLNQLNAFEAEKSLARDLMRLTLAGLPKKITR
jgi:hypothetical protein